MIPGELYEVKFPILIDLVPHHNNPGYIGHIAEMGWILLFLRRENENSKLIFVVVTPEAGGKIATIQAREYYKLRRLLPL